MKESKYRIEDGIHSVRTAREYGYCMGGGKSLINLITEINRKNLMEKDIKKHSICYNLFVEAAKFAIKVMCNNASLNFNVVLTNLLKSKKNFGVDMSSGKEINLLEYGIVDSVYALKMAIQNSISACKMLIQHGGSLTKFDTHNEN